MSDEPAPPRSLLIVAGEASGDLHGARLLDRLREHLSGSGGEVEVFGLGGDNLTSAGLDSVAHSSEISVVGITEALKILPRARQIFRRLLEEVDRRRPSTAVLIDFPEFNLRLAAELKKRGLRVVYYISPQVWAWRRRRVRKIARVVDRMLVLFPFEESFYRGHQIEVRHVGHPLVDEVPRLPSVWQREGSDQGPYRVALLPGSRRSEVASLLPIMVASVRALRALVPVEARLIRAPTVPRDWLEEQLRQVQPPQGTQRPESVKSARSAGAGSGPPVEIFDAPAERRFEALADSHFALCASGTATLEVGLAGTPMAVLYRLGFWTYLLARLMVKVPYASLVNLVLEGRVVPELIQTEARPQRVAEEVAGLLSDRGRLDEMRRRLSELRGRLGAPGASGRAAEEVAEVLIREVSTLE